jgi:hypothetical protein
MLYTLNIPADEQEIKKLIAHNNAMMALLLDAFRKGFHLEICYNTNPAPRDPNNPFLMDCYISFERDTPDYTLFKEALQWMAERYVSHNLLLNEALSNNSFGSPSIQNVEVNG